MIVRGLYPNESVKSGDQGIEVKTTRKKGGAVETHGARDQWMCVFVYQLDSETEPAIRRQPMAFTEVYLGRVTLDDFRRNPRPIFDTTIRIGSRYQALTARAGGLSTTVGEIRRR